MKVEDKKLEQMIRQALHGHLHTISDELGQIFDVTGEYDVIAKDICCQNSICVWMMAAALEAADDLDDELALIETLQKFVFDRKDRLMARIPVEGPGEEETGEEWADLIEEPEN